LTSAFEIIYLVLNVKSYLRMKKYKELESYINDFQSKNKSFSLSELITEIEKENRYLQNEMLKK
jgi:hypothetical protein